MAVSRSPGSLFSDPFSKLVPAKTPGPVGIRDQADPNINSNLGDTPGVLGRKDAAGQLADVRYLLAGGVSGKKSGKSRKTKVLNIVTSFPNPWRKDIKSEITAIKNGAWAPSTDDFEALVKNSHQVKHFHELIGVIIQRPKGSIARVNIFTHSNPRLIAFKGSITPRSTFADVRLEIASALSLDMLDKLTVGTWFEVGKSKKKHTMKDVSARFSEGAKVFFYSCKSATDPMLLQEFADKFQVTAVGFKDNICYCPIYTDTSINRKKVGIGRGCQQNGKNFMAIDKEGKLYKPKP